MDDNDDNYGLVNVSPSSKLCRITLVKHQKTVKQHSPSHQRSCNSRKEFGGEHDFFHEIDGPPSKLRRISPMNRMSTKPDHPDQENISLSTGFSSIGLAAACKELVHPAVSRGSLDDITVMIIDLNCFR